MTLPAGAGPTSIAVGDFNDDGFADLAVANKNANTVSIFLETAMKRSRRLPPLSPATRQLALLPRRSIRTLRASLTWR